MGSRKGRGRRTAGAGIGSTVSLMMLVVIILAGLWLFTQTPFGSDLWADISRQVVGAARDLIGALTSWADSRGR